ncbi:hypothetical protein [Martelella sp. HB161492]|uniref:hypothetical protein n=1 Tax=Martelella sp. HB161492 TaxID=2720726 RepID=UPI001591D308|nr:hypothetical protein [Martelella sp. HB161492]
MTNSRTTVEKDVSQTLTGKIGSECLELKSGARKWHHVRPNRIGTAEMLRLRPPTEDPVAVAAQLKAASFWRRKALLAKTIAATPAADRSALLKALAADHWLQRDRRLRDAVMFAALEHADGNDLTRIMGSLSPDQTLKALVDRPLPAALCTVEENGIADAQPRRWRLMCMSAVLLSFTLAACGLTELVYSLR